MAYKLKPARAAIFLASTTALISIAQATWAHTTSIGYVNAGPGAVTFWYGTYHDTNFFEGSLQLSGTGYTTTTSSFTERTQIKPVGLVDGTTNFYSNGTALVGVNSGQPTKTWQGATISGLKPGTYTFTYIPIAVPTDDWRPTDSVILSSSVFLSSAVIGFSQFEPNSSSASSPAAGVLDSITSSATGDMADAISALQDMDEQTQHQALQRVAPQTGQSLGQASSQAVTGALDSVAVRLDGIRSQGYTSAMADSLSRGNTVQVASNGDLGGLLDGEVYKKSFWSKAFGSYGKQAFADGFAGYNYKTGGMAFGGDTLLENNWLVGLALTYAYTDVSMNQYRSGDNDRINSYQATGYTMRNFDKYYVEGMVAYARQNFNTFRDTGVTGVAEGDFDGNMYAARATAGMPVKLDGGFTLTPSAGLEVNYLDQQGYTETGGGPLSLTVKGMSATRFRSSLQTKLSTEKKVGEYKLQPSLNIGWRHEFHNDGIDSTSSFTGGGASFTTAGQDSTRNVYLAGAGITVSKTRDFALSMQVDTEQARDYSGYAAQILGQWKF